jgi:hypothetical protein
MPHWYNNFLSLPHRFANGQTFAPLRSKPRSLSKPVHSNAQPHSNRSNLHLYIRRSRPMNAHIRFSVIRLGPLYNPTRLLLLTMSFPLAYRRGWRGEDPSSGPQTTERDQGCRESQNRTGHLEHSSRKTRHRLARPERLVQTKLRKEDVRGGNATMKTPIEQD